MVSMNPVGDLDYGMIGEAGTLEAEPGLWVNVTKVAGIQADLIINELLRGTSAHQPTPANTLIVTNNYMEIIEGQENDPHTGIWIEIGRDPRLPGLWRKAEAGRQHAGQGRRGQHIPGRSGGLGLDDRY